MALVGLSCDLQAALDPSTGAMMPTSSKAVLATLMPSTRSKYSLPTLLVGLI